MSDDIFDSDAACNKIRNVWLGLGDQIAAAIPDMLISGGDPVNAVRWATCAEACFWQATGEGNSYDVKDVLPKPHSEAD